MLPTLALPASTRLRALLRALPARWGDIKPPRDKARVMLAAWGLTKAAPAQSHATAAARAPTCRQRVLLRPPVAFHARPAATLQRAAACAPAAARALTSPPRALPRARRVALATRVPPQASPASLLTRAPPDNTLRLVICFPQQLSTPCVCLCYLQSTRVTCVVFGMPLYFFPMISPFACDFRCECLYGVCRGPIPGGHGPKRVRPVQRGAIPSQHGIGGVPGLPRRPIPK